MQNSMELISKAREMKFHLHIPKSLYVDTSLQLQIMMNQSNIEDG